MKEEDLNNIFFTQGSEYWPLQGREYKIGLVLFKAGFKLAFKMILEKREELGHGYLKGKLLDWMLELDINQ